MHKYSHHKGPDSKPFEMNGNLFIDFSVLRFRLQTPNYRLALIGKFVGSFTREVKDLLDTDTIQQWPFQVLAEEFGQFRMEQFAPFCNPIDTDKTLVSRAHSSAPQELLQSVDYKWYYEESIALNLKRKIPFVSYSSIAYTF